MVALTRVLGAVVVVGLATGLAAAVVTSGTPVYEPPLADGERIVDAHAAALESAGNFTYRDTTRIRVNGTLERNRTTTARFDTTTGVTLVESYNDVAGRRTVYDDGAGVSYERLVDPGGTVSYGQPLGSSTRISRYRRPGITPLIGDIEYTYEGPTRLDGVRVHEYAATSVDQIAGIVGQNATDPDADTTVDVRVFVSEDGVVRRMSILLTQRDGDRTRTLNSTLAYTAVGETSVQEPDWLETARNRTGPSR